MSILPTLNYLITIINIHLLLGQVSEKRNLVREWLSCRNELQVFERTNHRIGVGPPVPMVCQDIVLECEFVLIVLCLYPTKQEEGRIHEGTGTVVPPRHLIWMSFASCAT